MFGQVVTERGHSAAASSAEGAAAPLSRWDERRSKNGGERAALLPIMLTASFAFKCNCKQRFTVQVNIYKETGAFFILVNVEKNDRLRTF